MANQIPVQFSSDELWYLHSVVKHESLEQGRWENPTTSLQLNEAIADALLVCEESKLDELTVLLSMRDCLLLDYVVDQAAKTPKGELLGKPILLKTFSARRQLSGNSLESIAMEPETSVDIKETLKEFEKQYSSKRRSRRVKKEESE